MVELIGPEFYQAGIKENLCFLYKSFNTLFA